MMGLVTCPLTNTGGGGCAEAPTSVAERSCRDSNASTPRSLQIACWTNQASRRLRRRLAPDRVPGSREDDSHLRKNVRARINIRVPLRCAKFSRETSR